MMTPLRFEQLHQDEWSELEIAIGSVGTQTISKSMSLPPTRGARVALLYRRACEHLALARARAYPAYIVDRLERITEDAHQLIYHRPEVGMGRLRRVLVSEFPASVRAHRRYVAVAAAVFVLPMVIVGALVYGRPELILSVVSAETAASFEDMYSPAAESIGRVRTASTDWIMFGYYIRNNIGVSFQCFAGGLFAGLGTPVLPRLQRRVRGRAGRLSRGARAVGHVLFVRRHAFGVRTDRHRAVRRRRAAHRPLAARAGPAARDGPRWCGRPRTRPSCFTASWRCSSLRPSWRRSGPRRAGCHRPSSMRSPRSAGPQ